MHSSSRVADECYDPIFGENKLDNAAKDVRSDLLIIGNQIPFIVLLKLLQLELINPTVDVQDKLMGLSKVILDWFNPLDKKEHHIKQW